MHDIITGQSSSISSTKHLELGSVPARVKLKWPAMAPSSWPPVRLSNKSLISVTLSASLVSLWMDLHGSLVTIRLSLTAPLLHSSLSKHWNALSYHHCHEAVTAGFVCFKFLPGCENPSDILTKNLLRAKAHIIVEPFLFWKGETMSSGPLQRGVTG